MQIYVNGVTWFGGIITNLHHPQCVEICNTHILITVERDMREIFSPLGLRTPLIPIKILEISR